MSDSYVTHWVMELNVEPQTCVLEYKSNFILNRFR